jgi:hypothetical protein
VEYSQAKLKSSGDKAFPCFGPFGRGKLQDKYSPTFASLYVSFKNFKEPHWFLYYSKIFENILQ